MFLIMPGVLRISEAASLGLHAMMVLARDSSRMYSAGDLSEVLKVSEAHLAKVLQRLARVGLVKSTRGPHGGFVLGRPADEISLLEVYEAIDGPLGPVECLLHAPVCKGGQCIFGDLIHSISRQIGEHLAKTKLSTQACGGETKG
jgi:Rrf2 family protein